MRYQPTCSINLSRIPNQPPKDQNTRGLESTYSSAPSTFTRNYKSSSSSYDPSDLTKTSSNASMTNTNQLQAVTAHVTMPDACYPKNRIDNKMESRAENLGKFMRRKRSVLHLDFSLCSHLQGSKLERGIRSWKLQIGAQKSGNV